MYQPIWTQEFKRLNPDPRAMNSKQERLACDAMIDLREKAMKNSTRAQQWEADRKREWRQFMKDEKLKKQTYQDKVNEAKKNIAEAIKAKRKKLKNDKQRTK